MNSKAPNLRSAGVSLLLQADEIKKKLFEIAPEDLHPNCLNCDHWNEGAEKCGKYWVTPPLKIIVYGCPEWYNNDEDVPF